VHQVRNNVVWKRLNLGPARASLAPGLFFVGGGFDV
jgi:hypothetical protein